MNNNLFLQTITYKLLGKKEENQAKWDKTGKV